MYLDLIVLKVDLEWILWIDYFEDVYIWKKKKWFEEREWRNGRDEKNITSLVGLLSFQIKWEWLLIVDYFVNIYLFILLILSKEKKKEREFLIQNF